MCRHIHTQEANQKVSNNRAYAVENYLQSCGVQPSQFKTVEGVFGMNLIEIRELYKNQEAYLDKEITVGGWVRSIRGSKAFGFIVVNDGTFFEPLQVVYHDKMDNFAEISKLNVGAPPPWWARMTPATWLSSRSMPPT